MTAKNQNSFPKSFSLSAIHFSWEIFFLPTLFFGEIKLMCVSKIMTITISFIKSKLWFQANFCRHHNTRFGAWALFILAALCTLGSTDDRGLRNSIVPLTLPPSASSEQCSVFSKFINHYSLSIFIFLKQSVILSPEDIIDALLPSGSFNHCSIK